MGRPKLRFYDDLALHSAVADSATIAAVERVGSRRAGHKFHHGRNSLFQLEAVIIVRTKNEAQIALLVRSIRAEIDLESVRPVEGRDPQLNFAAAFYAEGRRAVLVLLCGHLDNLYFLGRLSGQSGEVGSHCKSTQQEQPRNPKYATQFFPP